MRRILERKGNWDVGKTWITPKNGFAGYQNCIISANPAPRLLTHLKGVSLPRGSHAWQSEASLGPDTVQLLRAAHYKSAGKPGLQQVPSLCFSTWRRSKNSSGRSCVLHTALHLLWSALAHWEHCWLLSITMQWRPLTISLAWKTERGVLHRVVWLHEVHDGCREDMPEV